jgi:D-arabinose 1-dehydrogenase-like Zn-dependent alcohol dehydrogenase
VEIGDAERLADDLGAAAQGDVDVTIDTLWGAPALAAMGAAARFARHIEIGSMAAPQLALPAALMRSKSIELRGFSVAHPPLEVKRDAYRRLTAHAAQGDIVVDVQARPLDEVEQAWERQKQAAGGPKQVLVP